MNKLRMWALITLADGDSVVLNSTINIYKDGAEPEFVFLVGKKYQVELGKPVLEVIPGALVSFNTIRTVDGRADRFVNM